MMKFSKKYWTLTLCIFVVLFSSFPVVCYVQKESFVSEANQGIWSDPYTAIHDQWHQPAQHFLCGYAVRQMKWTKLLNNCNCGRKFSVWKFFQFRCEWCQNTFWSMRNGFKTIYCSANDWLDQVTKVLETGNTDSRNWRQVKCPKGFYVKQTAPRFGVQLQTQLGLTGMQIVCSNLEQDQTVKIDENSQQFTSVLSQNRPGTFVSALRIKYEKNGKITGIRSIFEGIAQIKQAQITYGQVSGVRTKKLIETAQLINNGKEGKKIKVNLINNYTTTYSWKNQNSYFSAYRVSNEVQIKPPQFGFDKDEGLYTINRSRFAFQTPLSSRYVPTASLSANSFVFVPVSPLSNFTVSTVTEELVANVPYEMKVKFYDKTSGEFIIEKTFAGIFSGVVETPITMALEQSLCIPGWSKNSFVVNGDFEQNSCSSSAGWCQWNQASIKSNLAGWVPSPSLQIGRGNIYNPTLGNSWVSELDTSANTCIKQRVKLGPGKYYLAFDRTARVQVGLESSQMEVRLDGGVLKKIYPENYFPFKDYIEMTMNGLQKDYWLQFCGGGKSQGYGMVIDNIQLRLFNECAGTNNLKY